MDIKELESILSPFVEESDYITEPGVEEPTFNYTRCLKRVVAELSRLKDLNREIACGHTKGDLYKSYSPDAKEYCLICEMQNQIEWFKAAQQSNSKTDSDNECATIIPGTFIICGEQDLFYCSNICFNAAKESK